MPIECAVLHTVRNRTPESECTFFAFEFPVCRFHCILLRCCLSPRCWCFVRLSIAWMRLAGPVDVCVCVCVCEIGDNDMRMAQHRNAQRQNRRIVKTFFAAAFECKSTFEWHSSARSDKKRRPMNETLSCLPQTATEKLRQKELRISEEHEIGKCVVVWWW